MIICLLKVFHEFLNFYSYISNQLKSESLKINRRESTGVAMKLYDYKWKVNVDKRCYAIVL